MDSMTVGLCFSLVVNNIQKLPHCSDAFRFKDGPTYDKIDMHILAVIPVTTANYKQVTEYNYISLN